MDRATEGATQHTWNTDPLHTASIGQRSQDTVVQLQGLQTLALRSRVDTASMAVCLGMDLHCLREGCSPEHRARPCGTHRGLHSLRSPVWGLTGQFLLL